MYRLLATGPLPSARDAIEALHQPQTAKDSEKAALSWAQTHFMQDACSPSRSEAGRTGCVCAGHHQTRVGRNLAAEPLDARLVAPQHARWGDDVHVLHLDLARLPGLVGADAPFALLGQTMVRRALQLRQHRVELGDPSDVAAKRR